MTYVSVAENGAVSSEETARCQSDTTTREHASCQRLVRPSAKARAFSMVMICGLCVLCSAPGHSFGFNMMLDLWIKDLGISRTHLSALWMASLLASATLISAVGWLIDRYGSQFVLCIVVLPYVGSLLGLSIARNVYTLGICLCCIRFLGPECLVLAAYTTTNRWFVRRRGTAAAVLTCFDSLMLTLPAAEQSLISAHGWRAAYRVIAVAVGVSLVLVASLIRSRPEDVAMLPDGMASTETSGGVENLAIDSIRDGAPTDECETAWLGRTSSGRAEVCSEASGDVASDSCVAQRPVEVGGVAADSVSEGGEEERCSALAVDAESSSAEAEEDDWPSPMRLF